MILVTGRKYRAKEALAFSSMKLAETSLPLDNAIFEIMSCAYNGDDYHTIDATACGAYTPAEKLTLAEQLNELGYYTQVHEGTDFIEVGWYD